MVQIVLITSVIAAVMILQTLMPDSDSLAFVDGRQLLRARRAFPLQAGHYQAPTGTGTEGIQRRQNPSDIRFQNDTTPIVLICIGDGTSRTTSTDLYLTTVTVDARVSVPGQRPSSRRKATLPP